EGTPVSAIEALAAGRPVVATRVGGVPDVVKEGEEGFLVEPGETGELADRLAELARDPDLRERMGQAGPERVLPRYAVERVPSPAAGLGVPPPTWTACPARCLTPPDLRPPPKPNAKTRRAVLAGAALSIPLPESS